MLFYILLGVILIISGLFYKYSDEERVTNVVGSFFSSWVAGGFIIFVCCMESTWPEVKRDNYSRPIFSLKNDKDISGSFFLGSGGFGSEEKYCYFIKDERGGFYRENQYAYNCIIFEKDSVPPQIQWQIITYKCPSWIIPWTITKRQNTKFDLIVPENTIIQKFEVK